MIATDRTLKALVNLSLARQAEFGEATQRVYEHILRDTAPELVARACERLASQPRADYKSAMPEAGEIKAVATEIAAQDRVEAARQRVLPAPSDDDPRTWRYCNACDDSGWEEFWCVGDSSIPQPDYRLHLTARDCGRPREHTSHTYVQRCDCINRNPVIARRRELEAQQVIRRTPKGKA